MTCAVLHLASEAPQMPSPIPTPSGHVSSTPSTKLFDESNTLTARSEQLVRVGSQNRRYVGRPRTCPDEVFYRVLSLHLSGHSYRGICKVFNTENILTPGGGETWWPSHLSRLLRTRAAQEYLQSWRSQVSRCEAATTPAARAMR